MQKKEIERRTVEPDTLTGNRKPVPPTPKKAEHPEDFEPLNFKKRRTMMTFIRRISASKVGRTVTSLLGGLLGFGGASLGGAEIEFAILAAAAAIVAIFLGVDKAVKFFTAINDARNDNQKSDS